MSSFLPGTGLGKRKGASAEVLHLSLKDAIPGRWRISCELSSRKDGVLSWYHTFILYVTMVGSMVTFLFGIGCEHFLWKKEPFELV